MVPSISFCTHAHRDMSTRALRQHLLDQIIATNKNDGKSVSMAQSQDRKDFDKSVRAFPALEIGHPYLQLSDHVLFSHLEWLSSPLRHIE